MVRRHRKPRTLHRPAAAALLAALLASSFLSPPVAAEEETHHQGIDVSHHDEGIQWPAVRDAGITFAYIKATEGMDYADPLFAQHWKDARTAGVVRGAYHFFRALDDGTVQAEFFLKTLGEDPGELIPVVDVEVADGVDGATLLAELKEWLDRVEEATGAKPMIYTGVRFWNSLGTAAVRETFASYPLWVAEYGVSEPAVPDSWKSWALWQYTEDATVVGLGVPVDKSRTRGDLQHLDPPVLRIIPPVDDASPSGDNPPPQETP